MIPRTTVKLVVEGNFSATELAMACKSWSWRSLYCRLSKTTLQLFCACVRVCHSPRRGQESLALLFKRWRQGSMLTAAFICSAGRVCTAWNQMYAHSVVAFLIICPCFGRLFNSDCLLLLSTSCAILLATVVSEFLV